MFGKELTCDNAIEFNLDMYYSNIRSVVIEKLNCIDGTLLISNKVSDKGVEYRNSKVVILSVEAWKLDACIIMGIILFKSSGYLIVDVNEAWYMSNVGCYEV